MFKCYICGKEYNTPVEAANCTISCNDKLKEIKELEELKCSITTSFEDLQELCKEYSERNSDTNIYITFHSEPKECIKQKRATDTMGNKNTSEDSDWCDMTKMLENLFFGKD